MPKRTIVCLCGSTRFKEEFERANAEESLKGNIVLTVCWFTHRQGSYKPGAEDQFAALHYDKIDMADEIFVVNPGLPWCMNCKTFQTTPHSQIGESVDCPSCGPNRKFIIKPYIGEATTKEIDYATKAGKPIRYLNVLQ